MKTMSRVNLVAKLSAYYQQEINYTKVALINETDPIERGRICWYCLQRGLGACQFAQSLGMTFETAEALFEGLRATLKLLEEEA